MTLGVVEDLSDSGEDPVAGIRMSVRAVPIPPSPTSECVFGLEDLRGAFADDDAGGHGVSGGDAGHDRPVGDAKVFYPIDFQRAANHGHGVLAHLGGTGLVPVGQGGIPHEALELGTFE